MNNFFATDEEIKYAQDILLGKENHFSAEKIAVIKSNDSKDVVACPGSGKTTTLLAKLAILATRMPLEEGKGVCVLTHTNVAIDEIKSKLQSQADCSVQQKGWNHHIHQERRNDSSQRGDCW